MDCARPGRAQQTSTALLQTKAESMHRQTFSSLGLAGGSPICRALVCRLSFIIRYSMRKEKVQISAKILKGLQSPDLNSRFEAVAQLPVLAQCLGPERTKNELVPFLAELIDDQPQVLEALAKCMPFLAEIAGKLNFHVSLALLEQLLLVKEGIVRKGAIASYIKIVEELVDLPKHEDFLLGVMKKLEAHPFDGSKESLAQLIANLYKRFSKEGQSQTKAMFLKGLTDRSTAIRKYFSEAVAELAANPISDTIVASALESMIRDPVQGVKLCTIPALIKLTASQSQKRQSILANFVKLLSQQKCLRLKYQFIQKLPVLAQALGRPLFKSVLLIAYIRYFQVPEAELRCIAMGALRDLSCHLDPQDVVEKVLPALKAASTDSEQSVRIAFSSSLLQLAVGLNKQVVAEQVIPKFLALLKDQVPNVRLQLFRNISLMNRCFAQEVLIQSTLPSLTQLAFNQNWRVRVETIRISVQFSEILQAPDKLLKMLEEWATDKVFAVRQAALDAVSSFLAKVNPGWLQKTIISKILSFSKVPNYLHRETSVYLIEKIYGQVSAQCQKACLAVLSALASDPVPNVRLVVCRTLSLVPSKDRAALRRVISELDSDPDSDVKEAAALIAK